MFLKPFQPSSIPTYPSSSVFSDMSATVKASTISTSTAVKVKENHSTMSTQDVNGESKSQSKPAPASSNSLTRSDQRKTVATQRKKRWSTKEDSLSQMTLEERVHPIAKLLIIISLQLLRKGEVKDFDSPTHKTTFEAILEQISISEKEYDALADGTPFDIPPSPIKEVFETFEATKSQENLGVNLLPTPVTTEPFSGPLKKSKSTTCRRARLRSRPSYPSKQQCLDNHPLSFSNSSPTDAEFSFPSKHIELQQQQSIAYGSHLRSRIIPKTKSRPSFRSLKSVVNSISSYVSPHRLTANPTSKTIGSLDPRLLPMDACLPLRIENVPTPHLRWYLNPTTHSPIEAHTSPLQRKRRQRGCLVSIQMQTYKISISKIEPLSSVISLRTKWECDEKCSKDDYEPRVRRRDMRENSEFLRVAVMEMLMRRRGKLDEQRPGKARIVLPPRTLSIRPTEMTADGIPVRWVSHSA